nr:retrovirus-related Pol polyprotein from transposon TNT 1-94 [Tanacetum cinerariifolium]
MVTPTPQDRWSKGKHIKLVNIIGNPGAGMLIRAMAKEISDVSAHECLLIDILSEQEPKKFTKWMSKVHYGKLKEEVYVKQPPGFESMKTLMVPLNNLGPDLNGKAVNETQYRENLKESHLTDVKRIFKYLKGTPSLGLSDHVLKGDIELNFIPTQYKLVDIFTKPLEESTFKRLIVELGFTPTCRVIGDIDITAFRNAFKCLGGKTGGLDQIFNKDATILYCLANRVQVDYAKIIWDDLIHKLNKKTREKFSVHNLTLNLNQPREPPFTDHMKAICTLVVPVDSKAPKPSSQTKKVPQGKKPRATTGLGWKRSSKHISESRTEASKSQTIQSKIETQSSSANDKILSHPSPPTLVVCEMHKKTQHADGGPTSLGATSEEGAHPQLSSAKADLGSSTPNDSIPPQQDMDEGTKNTLYDHIFVGSNPNVLVDKSKSARDGLKIVHTESDVSKQLGADEISKKIKLDDLADLLKDTRSAFFTPDSPPDEPINVSDESLLKTVTKTLNRFATLVENATGSTNMVVPSTDKAATSPAEGEKDADTNLKNKLVDFLGIDIVTQEDGTAEVIETFKAIDLQLAA